MTKSIVVSQYISSGFSSDDADNIIPIIDVALKNMGDDDSVVLDFSKVKFFTTRFFNLALARLLEKMPFGEYMNKIKVINLSEVGQIAYQHSLDNARHQSTISSSEKMDRVRILEKLLQEK
ncbi:MAG: STAS-like domain-containing protein [Selenomonadaceae bacterium]|nr:STAS-like domain-containing protein [Selenomonadaceae bacterium]